MEGVFTLPYSEYEVINKMSKLLKKQEGYSFFIPTSRQQKGVDFVILNQKSKKLLRVQVKSSRSYNDYNKEQNNYLWFNNFLNKYEKGNADLYVLYGLYPQFKEGNKVNAKNKSWRSIILCFSEKEMFKLLDKVKTKKENKPDKFFSFVFDKPEDVCTNRGFQTKVKLNKYLLDNYQKNIEKRLK